MNIDQKIHNIRQINSKFNALMGTLTIQQLNAIPSGFHNNIIWNYAHLIATQQRLFYMFSNLPAAIDMSFVDAYRSGTKPERDVTIQEVENIKQLYNSAIDQFERDYQTGVFKEFNSYTTSSLGITMYNIDDAITTSTIHDGLHLGYAMALKHLV